MGRAAIAGLSDAVDVAELRAARMILRMTSNLRIAAIVPMRHFSRRVPGKNYRLLTTSRCIATSSTRC